MIELTREQVLAQRVTAQQLDRAPASEREVTDAAILDLGVQDTGPDGASWALTNRGVPVASPDALTRCAELALVWTLRASPHYYRRSQLLDVLVATSPFSDADAAKRIVGAAKPLHEAGIGARAGLAEVAGQLRRIVDRPRGKGDVSTRLTAQLSEPYLRECRPCGAVHAWEVPFRLGALYGGLELAPGTSPPVLRRIPDWPRRSAGPAGDPEAAPDRLQPIRGYLRFLGPATPADVAGFLDAPLREIREHWPQDATEVRVDGERAWTLGSNVVGEPDPDLVRLLGPFDLFLQARDRPMLVPDKPRQAALWPVLGRPGAVLAGAELIGTWRPRAAGGRFTVRLSPWQRLTQRIRDRVEEEAERLAQHRRLAFAGVDVEPAQ